MNIIELAKEAASPFSVESELENPWMPVKPSTNCMTR